MVKLSEIWPQLDKTWLSKFGAVDINRVTGNSKQVTEGDLFVALKGPNCDGHDFIEEAVRRGARVVVRQEESRFPADGKTIFIPVKDSHTALANLAANFYGNPCRKLKVVGITGTNGKTTVTYLLEKIINAAGFSCGVIGTINYRIKERVIPATNTTPGVLELQGLFGEMVKERIGFCVMEVSSHALDQGRTAGVDFAGGIFTNLASDHLDYHLNRQNYFCAKAKLFQDLKNGAFAVINADDAIAEKLYGLTRADIVTYALRKKADFMVEDIALKSDGTDLTLVTPQGKAVMQTRLLGEYNLYNLLAAAAAGYKLGFDLPVIKKGIAALELVPGRMETVDCGQPFKVIVDFAHTEDALKSTLKTLLRIAPSSRIILVFGCGGSRDRGKREKMGAVASQLADFSIVTSDNPRQEDPQQIIAEIVKGFTAVNKYQVIPDRSQAIKEAIALAKEKDIVLIAGKGHEAYQIFRDRVVPFDDRLEARKALSEKH
ncbi:MAG: UDP-N-acetylmuramoyl-L-alanyl-D-glutamate--2,6-diaminopimelate ligase [Candidatus Omnitrophota bacterium]